MFLQLELLLTCLKMLRYIFLCAQADSIEEAINIINRHKYPQI